MAARPARSAAREIQHQRPARYPTPLIKISRSAAIRARTWSSWTIQPCIKI